jgi:hypothetical protein
MPARGARPGLCFDLASCLHRTGACYTLGAVFEGRQFTSGDFGGPSPDELRRDDVSHLTRRWAMVAALACLACGALSSSALASTGKPMFRPRIGNGLGLAPPLGNHVQEPSESGVVATPVTYHGGSVMNGTVHVHTIFWAPPGFHFEPTPPGASASYVGMIEKYLTDQATGYAGATGCSASDCNGLSVLPQFGQGTTPASTQPGATAISYNTANPQDVIMDTDPYPSGQCVSPQDEKACISDQQLQDEVDHVITTVGGNRGLHNLWEVILPPDVDECIFPGACGTTAFGGYHSLSNEGHGVAIYALIIDPVIETPNVFEPGHDPQGFPDAERTVDVVAHETLEAMTDPTGVGWMDPNGYEIGDKCEFDPAIGTPLGTAGPDNAPYNQVINGDKWQTQEMWSNADSFECTQGTTNSADPLPLPQVSMHQFSSKVSGNTENNTGGIGVKVRLLRANASGGAVTVASASTTTNGTGGWSVTLPNHHAVGDDRDKIDITYSGAGAPTPHRQVILTGNGGDPYNEAGWTGWTALNQGNVLTNNDQAPWATITTGHPSLTMAPCFQTGVLGYAINGTPGGKSPTNFCSTSFDTADTPLGAPVSRAQAVTASSNDNRAFAALDTSVPNPFGGLVKLTVPVGEPDSTSPFTDPFGITPSGPPACTADLGVQVVSCVGLVPGDHYTVADGSHSKGATADRTGAVTVALPVARGDLVRLSNGSRTLTALHVANLRVHLDDDSGAVASGICSPNQYWGGPLTSPPANASAGDPTALAGGSALTGEICPQSGSAAGLPTDTIGQTDERSGGQTVTEVADIANTSPMDAETMYGRFTALAETTDGTSPVSLRITPSSGGKPVAFRKNVNTASGASIGGIKPGTYTATWTVTNPNGDTRTVSTRFIEQSGAQGPRGKRGPQGPPGRSPKVRCQQMNGRHHHKSIRCNVAFAHAAHVQGLVRMRITRGGSVAALGHGRLHNGSTTVTMRELRSLKSGTWRITLVYSSGRTKRTVSMRLLVV